MLSSFKVASTAAGSGASGRSGGKKGTKIVASGGGAKAKSADTPSAHQRSQHRAVITIVHTKTLTLARTVQKYPRKHRDLSGVLGDAVEALEEFKDVEWPPRKAEMEEILEDVPSWLGGENEAKANGRPESKVAATRERRAVSDGSLNGMTEGNDGGEGSAAAAEDLEKELEDLEDSDVNDEKEAVKLHQAVLHAGEEVVSDEAGEGGDNSKESEAEEEGEFGENSEKEYGVPSDTPPCGDEKDKAAAVERFESIIQKREPKDTQPKAPPPPNFKSIVTSKPSNKKSNYSRKVPIVDAAAMEPMHPAVITTLHALCMVISSDSKTPKMAELALECVTILTNGRYVSGVAGGRMKLEQQKKLSESMSKAGRLQQQIKAVITSGDPTGGAGGHDGRDGGLSFLGYVVESITRASDASAEGVQGGMAKALLAIMTCQKCGVHEAAMLQAVRSTFHVYLVGKSVMGKELAKRTLVDMLKTVFNRMEAYDIVSKDAGGSTVGGENDSEEAGAAIAASKSSGEDDATAATSTTAATATKTATNGTNKDGTTIDEVVGSAGGFASQYHTDSYLLFRALCKLSSKTLPGDENVGNELGMGSAGGVTSYFSPAPVVDPLALNSKILSLELILAVFEHCGDAFRHGEKFVYAVQSYLCVSLLKNCMSNQTVVAHLSLKIFLLLVSSEVSVCLHGSACTYPFPHIMESILRCGNLRPISNPK